MFRYCIQECGFLKQVRLVEEIFTITLNLSLLKLCAFTFKQKLGTPYETKKKMYLLHPHISSLTRNSMTARWRNDISLSAILLGVILIT